MINIISKYTNSVKNGIFQCNLDMCPFCKRTPDAFKRHDCRNRSFLLIIDGLVHKVKSYITRWRCPFCGHSFTVYPEFALPYKRYVRYVILEKSTQYIEAGLSVKEKKVTYRSLAKENKMAIGYACTESGHIDERQFAHSTIHRWLSTLSCFTNTLNRARQLIKQKSPSSTIFRNIIPISPKKYRSNKRKEELQICRQLLLVDREYRKLFGPSVFPHLATVCQWK